MIRLLILFFRIIVLSIHVGIFSRIRSSSLIIPVIHRTDAEMKDTIAILLLKKSTSLATTEIEKASNEEITVQSKLSI